MTRVHRALPLLNIPKNMSRHTLLLLWNVSLASQRRLPLQFDVLFCPRYVLTVFKKSPFAAIQPAPVFLSACNAVSDTVHV